MTPSYPIVLGMYVNITSPSRRTFLVYYNKVERTYFPIVLNCIVTKNFTLPKSCSISESLLSLLHNRSPKSQNGGLAFFVVVVVVSRYCIVTIQKKVFISYTSYYNNSRVWDFSEIRYRVYTNECLVLSITSTDFIINKRAIYAMFRTKSPNK